MKYYKWKLWCPEHQATLHTDFRREDQGPPTCCPLNSAHTNISGVAIIEKLDTGIVDARIVELDPDSDWDPNVARTRYDGFIMQMPSGQVDSYWDRQLDVDVQIVSGEHYMPDDDPYWNCGDCMSFLVIPPNNGVLGVLTGNVSEGDTEIPVSSTVLENTKTQFHLVFTDLATFETRAYRIKGFDIENSKVILYEELEEDVPAGSYVCLRIIYLNQWPVYKDVVQRFAADTPGAAMIPSGYTFRAVYHHEEVPTVSHHRHFGITEKYMPLGTGEIYGT